MWLVKSRIAGHRRGTLKTRIKITGNMHIDGAWTVLCVNRIFLDRNPYFALFGTGPHTYLVLNSEIRTFVHKYLLNLPRFRIIV